MTGRKWRGLIHASGRLVEEVELPNELFGVRDQSSRNVQPVQEHVVTILCNVFVVVAEQTMRLWKAIAHVMPCFLLARLPL